MWPFVIIQASPVFDHDPGLCQVMEEFGIETFSAKRAVEAFVAPILPRLTGFNLTRENLLVFQESHQIVRNELGPVVASEIPWASIADNKLA